MLRAASPAAGDVRTTGSHVLDNATRPSATHHDPQRPSYRLFPAVEPTPPASPLPVPRKTTSRVSDYAKKRSISLDESARAAFLRQNVQIKSVPVNRRPKIQTSHSIPMSALQESPLDSPTVPIRYSVISKSSDDYHYRSSSAPGEYIRDSQTLPSTKPVWTSKQQDANGPKGLGLSMPMPTSRLADRPSSRQGPHKAKPSLTIQIKPDKPPPPPPKSPRHYRTPSVQSGVSSMHGESPASDTPGSILNAALVDTQGSPVQMPPSILHAKQGSYSSASSDLRVREIVVTKDQTSQAKPGPTPAVVQTHGKSPSQNDANLNSRLGSAERAKDSAGETSQSTTPRPNNERSLDGNQFPSVPVNRAQTGAAKLLSLGIGPATSASKTPQHSSKSSRSNIEEQGRGSRAGSGAATQLASTPATQRHGPSRSRSDITEQADEGKNEIRAAAQSMLDRARMLTAETRASSKPSKPNLDKPMPRLPPNTGTFHDHIREVREAELSEKNKRPVLKPGPPSLQSSKASEAQPASRSPPSDSIPGRSSPAKAPKNTAISELAGSQNMSRSNSPSASQTSLVSQNTVPSARDRSESKSTAPTSTAPPTHSSRPAVDAQLKTASWLSSLHNTATRDMRSPTPDIASRAQSPQPAAEQLASLSTKALPISFTRGSLLMRSSTPDGASGNRGADPGSADYDPIQVLQDINKQVDGLHARYTQLRTDRLKLSTAISASLKDQKPGPDYANALLDQHLSLNALSSSMDICFAKLKALDCRKEDAIATLIARSLPQTQYDDPPESPERAPSVVVDEEETTPATAINPATSIVRAVDSGRATPEIEPKTLNSTLYQAMKPSPSIAASGSSGKPTPEINTDISAFPSVRKSNADDSKGSEKRITVIRDLPDAPNDSDRTELLPPISPVSAISSFEEEGKTRRIRIKGAKAAKLLGLVAESGNGKLGSRDITLPDNTSIEATSQTKQLAIEVEIQSRRVDSEEARPRPPFQDKAQIPKRKPVASPRQGTNDSVGSITASSMSESAPEEPDVKTPRHSHESAPFGLKSAKRGMLQTIQVFVDDDILDSYYRNSAEA